MNIRKKGSMRSGQGKILRALATIKSSRYNEATMMGELIFVGLGLHDEKGISLRGLEETKTAKSVFIELYTSLLPGFSLERFEKVIGKKTHSVSRQELEEKNAKVVFDAARTAKTVLLVPGDPLISTTHVAVRIQAERFGIRTRVVNGASALSAVIGLSGLHNYKFGKSVTIPFPDETKSDTPYTVIAQNKNTCLHTLCFLDIKAEEQRFMNIKDALKELLNIEARRKMDIVTEDTLAVGIARAGSESPTVKAGKVKDIAVFDFGQPPHSLVFPGELHFMEVEALTVLAGAPQSLRRKAQ